MPTDYTREMADINEEVQTNLRGQRQPSDAHYYAFNNANGRPQASLIVLIDDERRALRAELHYLAALSAEAQTALRRRAQGILGLHYTGVGPAPRCRSWTALWKSRSRWITRGFPFSRQRRATASGLWWPCLPLFFLWWRFSGLSRPSSGRRRKPPRQPLRWRTRRRIRRPRPHLRWQTPPNCRGPSRPAATTQWPAPFAERRRTAGRRDAGSHPAWL